MATSPAAAGPVLTPTRGTAALRRSARLLRAFRTEQQDPHRFYELLAADSVGLVARHARLDGAVVLDVGAGPGFFAGAFAAAGARYLGLEADAGEFTAFGIPDPPGTLGRVTGDGGRLPLADGSVDVCFSSNVLEHVPQPWLVADEMLRVTRPGGLLWLAYPAWLGPWGGHETSPWHWLGGRRAADRYARRHGHRPKNDYGRTMFGVSVSAGLRWARAKAAAGEADVVEVRQRYLPDLYQPVLLVPGVREVLAWNLVLALRPRGREPIVGTRGPDG